MSQLCPVHLKTACSINTSHWRIGWGQHSPEACSSGLIQKAGGLDIMQLFSINTTAASNKPSVMAVKRVVERTSAVKDNLLHFYQAYSKSVTYICNMHIQTLHIFMTQTGLRRVRSQFNIMLELATTFIFRYSFFILWQLFYFTIIFCSYFHCKISHLNPMQSLTFPLFCKWQRYINNNKNMLHGRNYKQSKKYTTLQFIFCSVHTAFLRRPVPSSELKNVAFLPC